MDIYQALRKLGGAMGAQDLSLDALIEYIDGISSILEGVPSVANNQDIFYNKNENVIDVEGRVVECQSEKELALLAVDNDRSR